jgi:hypothetical protein
MPTVLVEVASGLKLGKPTRTSTKYFYVTTYTNTRPRCTLIYQPHMFKVLEHKRVLSSGAVP